MNTFVNVVQQWFEVARANRLLLLPAAVMVVALLSFYVHLLHETVARGEAFRREQQSGAAADRTGAAGPARIGRATDTRSVAVAAGR